MIRSSKRMSTYLHQQGATLIVVLFILLVVTIVGAMAIRIAIVSLGVATNSQINQLNFQSSDTPLAWFNNVDTTTVTDISNVLGAALKEHESNPGAEYIFCYKPTSTAAFAKTINASLIQAGTNNNATVIGGGVAGFCDLDSDFGSNRSAVITQVAVSIPTDASNGDPGSELPRGINVSEGTPVAKSMTTKQRIRVTTTAILPSYSSDSTSTIESNCLSTGSAKISDNLDSNLSSKQTLAQCLELSGVPYSTQIQEFSYTNQLTQVTAPGS